MENENKVDDVETKNEDIEIDSEESEEDTEDVDDTKEEKKDDKKPSETLEQREARLMRQLQQTRKKLGKADEQPVRKDDSLGEKAFLIANGIKGADEIALVNKLKKETGRDVDSLIESSYFKSELKDLRETRASAEATPKGTKRSAALSTDSVEYWIKKGELPPKDNIELRRAVVNAKMGTDKNKNTPVFYNSRK